MQTATYTINTTSFDMQQALGGQLVTLLTTVGENFNVLTDTGSVKYYPEKAGSMYAPYQVVINKKTYWADEDGVVREGPDNIDSQLHLVTAVWILLMETYRTLQEDWLP